jgi:hypothetical protein
MKNRNIIFSLVIIVVGVVALVFALRKDNYVSKIETLTFERNIDADEGRQLNPADLITTDGVRLLDIYSLNTKKFTSERFSRYGADRTKQGGEGVRINFVQKGGGKVDTAIFTLNSWKYFEQTTRPVRRKEVEEAEPYLASLIENFVASVGIKRAFGIALDVTEGVTPELAKRVREVVENTHAVQFGIDLKNNIVLNMYNITESPYQGGRQRPNLNNPEEVATSINWLLQVRPEQSQSSILRGLIAICTEMEYKEWHPVLHVFTNGLENLPELSVYKHPEFLNNEAGWSKLDQIADLSKLKLEGMEIHLHPLPVSKTSPVNLMEKGLNYLADRLTKAGASVIIEPL